MAKAARWDVTDAETRKRGEQTGLQLSHVPNVFVGRPLSADERDVQYVDTDNVEGGRLATQHLIDRGCRRIAHDRRSGRHVRRHRPALTAGGTPSHAAGMGTTRSCAATSPWPRAPSR